MGGGAGGIDFGVKFTESPKNKHFPFKLSFSQTSAAWAIVC